MELQNTCIDSTQSSCAVFRTPRAPSEDNDETTHWFHLGEPADWILRKSYQASPSK